MDYRAAEQAREMKVTFLQAIDVTVMRVQAGGVMDVDARERRVCTYAVDDRAHQLRFWCLVERHARWPGERRPTMHSRPRARNAY